MALIHKSIIFCILLLTLILPACAANQPDEPTTIPVAVIAVETKPAPTQPPQTIAPSTAPVEKPITPTETPTTPPETPTESPPLPTETASPPTEPPSPAPTRETIAYACPDVEANWGHDWETTIAALAQLIAGGQSCGPASLADKLYAAHFSYAVSLQQAGQIDPAVVQYQAALRLDPQRSEARQALTRLQALPPATPVSCQSTAPPLPDPAPAEPPDLAHFVTRQAGQLQWQGEPFRVRGVNYYPRRAPWHRFMAEADPAEMAIELETIKGAGFNTVRLFLRYEPLFICQPEEAIPDEAALAKLDQLLALAGQLDLKLIVTLNDLPDLTFRPLYTDWAHYDNQTRYIVRRYRNEPHILAWDLRNEGDLDYGVRPGDEPAFSQEVVLAWLAHISQLVRENDPHHLLTAGWWGDPTLTAPYVDILSFHHWFEADQLQARLTDYQARLEQPLLLQEVGYHSWAAAPHDPRDDLGQADILGRVIALAEREQLAGWLVWTAFDFEPQPGRPHNFEHFFGLWRVDLTPKPALAALPLQ